MKKVYFDNAATTKPENAVIEAMMPYLNENFGNASSIHSFGKTAKVLLEDTRDVMAGFLGVKPREIFFTSGGTEANNFALKGAAFKQMKTGKGHIITSAIEHMAVLETVEYLEKNFGFEVSYLPSDGEGRISSGSVNNEIRENTFLVSIMHSNNETGAINDIAAISGAAAERKLHVHTDSIQSIGKTELKLKALNVNTATLSAHKIYGPKGIAALYIRDGIGIDKFIHGGSQERDMRGGTENIPAIAGFKKAVEILMEKQEADIKHYKGIKSVLIKKLKEEFDDLIIFNTPERNSLPNIINISFDSSKNKFDPETLLIKLDLRSVAVSGGSACTSGTLKPSHVITALGRDPQTALATLRISIGRENTTGDAEYLITQLKEAVK